MDRYPDKFDPQVMASAAFQRSHTGWLGLRYSDHGEDWVELELPWRADLLGDERRPVLASGPIISLVDMASGMAIWTAAGTFVQIATLDLRVDYNRPAREHASVFGRMRCYRRTRSAMFVNGIAHDGDIDDPIAHVAGVFMVIRPTKGDVRWKNS
ncbi:PaaI family thioesterase [Altererythrobacter sp. FM1]|uniref:PaaI family thioesterase n=1 Tax=Tsuneonella flava TaxID=2055955 RepID=A0ABX7KCA4_9SPHN|nr:PaaI family thioesterase [Tsuneonella flava]ROT93364.1 PaaI family thioesterase [Altererythrobacter sp. FM1]